jgi:hypothetical protein
MPLYTWGALAVYVIAIVGGLAVAGVRGLRTWRDFRRARRIFTRRLGEVSRGVEGMETRLDHLDTSSARLARARARLQQSLAGASVIADAIGDVQAALRVAAFLRR